MSLRRLPAPSWMDDDQLAAEAEQLLAEELAAARRWACPRPDCDGEPHPGWPHRHARATQHIPPAGWRVWLMLGARGWGKTRAATEALKKIIAESTQPLMIAMIAKKHKNVIDVCMEAREVGLLSVLDPDTIRKVNRSEGSESIVMVDGTEFIGFSAENPENLRGYAFDVVWGDEYAAWPLAQAQAVYDMAWLTLRESPDPRMILTTTPKAVPHIRKLVDRGKRQPDRVVVIRGRMDDNRPNLSAEAITELEETYGGTRLGRQELAGELLVDVEGALWQQWMLDWDGFRPKPSQHPELVRKVVAVDVAVTSSDGADRSALLVAGRDAPRDSTYADPRPHGYALHLESGRYTPTGTMERAARLYHEWEAEYVVLEANNGGDYLQTVLRQVDPTVPARLLYARKSKRARAAPVAMLYEQARVHHVGLPGQWDTLEGQQTSYVGVETEKSPDELDALVWAMTDLLLGGAEQATKRRAQDRRLVGRR